MAGDNVGLTVCRTQCAGWVPVLLYMKSVSEEYEGALPAVSAMASADSNALNEVSDCSPLVGLSAVPEATPPFEL
ncbi:Uncharacterised protein [Providencia rettgeri]|uniref:Uncharacterized protein n=1 Tax=Providencia rettgeri TaxID=587 RepID=A0A379FTN8_PRORE|nr:Uncharacterised protein [Providencia rettgeri]